jgi:hypothetical protein
MKMRRRGRDFHTHKASVCLFYESALNPWALSGKGLAILRNTRLCDLGVGLTIPELFLNVSKEGALIKNNKII